MSERVLRILLWHIGIGLDIASRFMPSVRAQITRSLVFEVSAGDRVIRQWRFDATRRRVTSVAARAQQPDGVLHFDSSTRAVRRLLSPSPVDGIVDDWHNGRAHVEGSAALLLWFHGLVRRLIKIGTMPGPSKPLPHGYIRPDPTAGGSETILIEPAVNQLDPEWSAAWRARATLPNVRATTGEPVTG